MPAVSNVTPRRQRVAVPRPRPSAGAANVGGERRLRRAGQRVALAVGQRGRAPSGWRTARPAAATARRWRSGGSRSGRSRCRRSRRSAARRRRSPRSCPWRGAARRARRAPPACAPRPASAASAIVRARVVLRLHERRDAERPPQRAGQDAEAGHAGRLEPVEHLAGERALEHRALEREAVDQQRRDERVERGDADVVERARRGPPEVGLAGLDVADQARLGGRLRRGARGS